MQPLGMATSCPWVGWLSATGGAGGGGYTAAPSSPAGLLSLCLIQCPIADCRVGSLERVVAARSSPWLASR